MKNVFLILCLLFLLTGMTDRELLSIDSKIDKYEESILKLYARKLSWEQKRPYPEVLSEIKDNFNICAINSKTEIVIEKNDSCKLYLKMTISQVVADDIYLVTLGESSKMALIEYVNSSFVDDDVIRQVYCIYLGQYTYETVLGATKTVNRYRILGKYQQ
jgi:hypothetical protein